MNDDDGFNRILHNNGLTLGHVEPGRFTCKYYCHDCKKLQLPKPGVMPTECGNCKSANIDIEEDFYSTRLEKLRFGVDDPMLLQALEKEYAGRKHIEQAKRAERIIRSIEFSRPGGKGTENDRITKESLTEMGKLIHSEIYKGVQSEDDVEDFIESYIDEFETIDPVAAMLFGESMRIPDQFIMTIGSGCWYSQGLPVIRLGHRRAAALMATEFTPQSVEFVKAPFRAFYIELPSELIPIEDGEGITRLATGLLVHARTFLRDRKEGELHQKAGTYWNYALLTDSSLVLWKLNRTAEELAGLSSRDSDWVGMGIPLTDKDTRIDQLIGRLICSTCIMMSNPENLKTKIEAAHRNKTGKKAAKDSPTYQVFLERKPINVDVRRYVSAYLKGERDSPHVRLMVRGHHKMQHYGPQRSLRKPVWIEPYMRGGGDGDPIMHSIYVAKDKDGKVPEAGGV